jgi:hypothetical protein
MTPNEKEQECLKFISDFKSKSPHKFIKFYHRQISKVCNHRKKIDDLDKAHAFRKRYIIEHHIIT